MKQRPKFTMTFFYRAPFQNTIRLLAAFLVLMLLPAHFQSQFAGAQNSENGLPSYRPEPLAETRLTSVGSDSMGSLVRIWVEEYRKLQPEVSVQIASRGSATAAAALIEGSADLGPMVRPMKSNEREEFIAAYGFEPTQVRTALSAVTVYVAESNPIKSLNFAKLERLFGKKPERSTQGIIQSWGELGVKSALKDTAIAKFRMTDDSPLSGFFRQQVLLQGEYQDGIALLPDNAEFCKLLAQTDNPLFVGPPNLNCPGMRALAISKEQHEAAVLPTTQNIALEVYPLARYLHIYFVREPGELVDASLRDFLRFVLSKEGQAVVARQGLIPLTVGAVEEELSKLR